MVTGTVAGRDGLSFGNRIHLMGGSMKRAFFIILVAVCILPGCAAFREALQADAQELAAATAQAAAATAPLDLPAPVKAGAALVGGYLVIVARRFWRSWSSKRAAAAALLAAAAAGAAEAMVDPVLLPPEITAGG